MATKSNPGKFDCYDKAEADEPIFVLLGRDKHAPSLVCMWSMLRELDNEDQAKVEEARECARDMIAWANGHGRNSVGLWQGVLAGVLELIRVLIWTAPTIRMRTTSGHADNDQNP
jgi:hypothetical protein